MKTIMLLEEQYEMISCIMQAILDNAEMVENGIKSQVGFEFQKPGISTIKSIIKRISETPKAI